MEHDVVGLYEAHVSVHIGTILGAGGRPKRDPKRIRSRRAIRPALHEGFFDPDLGLSTEHKLPAPMLGRINDPRIDKLAAREPDTVLPVQSVRVFHPFGAQMLR